MKKKTFLYVGLLLAILGVSFMVYSTLGSQGSVQDLLIDKNGDGIINWKDCDLNRDGVLDIFDSLLMSGALNTAVGEAGYNPNCDLDGDQRITTIDEAIFDYYVNQFRLMLLGWTEYFDTSTSHGQLMVLGLIIMILGLAVVGYSRVKKT